MIEPIHLNGHCYVLLQGNWIHPIAHQRHDLLWYPERAMTLCDQYRYRPYVQSVVTECAWIIALYDRERVLVVDEDGTWRRPNWQTYAASQSFTLHSILGIPSEVPALPLDGGKMFKKVVREYKKRIDKAAKIYKHI
jgi:hypothetical protein